MIDALIRGRREASGARREGCPKIGYPRAERQPGGRPKGEAIPSFFGAMHATNLQPR
jgi:hypothetical protein